MKPQHLPSNCLPRVYDELFACFCMEKFFPGSGRYAEMVALLHQRYSTSTYGEAVYEEIDDIAEYTCRWANEICSQFRELRIMIARYPLNLRRRRGAFAVLKDAIYFSALPLSRKNILIAELKRLRRRARAIGSTDANELLSELFLRHHSSLLARELHLKLSEPLLRSVDQVLRAEILSTSI